MAWIVVIVLVVSVVAATRWMQATEARLDALNRRVAELEREIERMGRGRDPGM